LQAKTFTKNCLRSFLQAKTFTKNRLRSFLQAKTFTKNRLRNFFCKQKPLLKTAYAISSRNCWAAPQKKGRYRSSGEIHNLSWSY
jgi:hypothetical protein